MFLKLPTKMKIYVSPFLLKGRIPIDDNSNEPKINKKDGYQLVFTTGEITLKIFKLFYLQNTDSYFVVSNMEHFLLKMRIFRNLQFIHLEGQREKGLGSAGKAIIEDQIIKKMKEKYSRIEKNFGKGKDIEKGIELSFQPRMLESIRSSLESSSLYKSKDMKCHGVFKCLEKGKISLDDFKNDIDSQKTIKSLIFAGILIKKEDSFCLSELLN